MLSYTIGQTCVHIIATHLLALAESEFDILVSIIFTHTDSVKITTQFVAQS